MINKDFVTAGKAIFTVSNGKGEWFTYKVSRKESENDVRPPMFFVSLLTGPDNTQDYSYMGCLSEYTGKVRLTQASRVTEQAKSFKVINWALGIIWQCRALPEGYTIHHEGRCGRCGRTLTTPESVERGIGPECAEKLCGVM